jgi:hypothetical protein
MPVAAQILLGTGMSNGRIAALAAAGLMCAFLDSAPYFTLAFIVVVCATTPRLFTPITSKISASS